MYELADWGSPVAPSELAPSELAQRSRLVIHLSHNLIRILRSRARAQGVTLESLIDRTLNEALAMPSHHRQRPRVIAAVD